MKQELEIEYKNMLTQDEYTRLYSSLFDKSDDFITQINHYFDTPDFALKNSKCALRIRIKEDSAEITLKTPFEGHHQETNIDLPLNQAREIIDEESFILPEDIKKVLSSEGISINTSVHKIAELKTERLEKSCDDTLIVLDKSYYFEIVDYELEVEGPTIHQAKKMFDQLLTRYSIPERPTENKISRAFNQIQSTSS